MNSLFNSDRKSSAINSNETEQSILLVEDEVRMRSSLRLLLDEPGRNIAEAGTGLAAIECLKTRKVDLVLLDINLPDITGLKVLEWISDNDYPAYVIMLTADRKLDSAILALRQGARDFIKKPFEAAQIQQKVKNALYDLRLERSHAMMASRLERSEHLHRFLVENSPDLIYTLDQFGCFTFVNSRFESLLGYTFEELLGQPYFTIVYEEDIAKAHYAFNERRKDSRVTNNLEVRLKCKAGDSFKSFDSRCITAMLSAMGIYNENDDLTKPSVDNSFMGTYGVARDITERKAAEETIAFHAFHDQLTLLPNQRLFKDRMEMAIANASRRGAMLGVMFIDLDRFKLINDTYGHAEGDELLKVVATRINNCMRSGDTVARKGGDEFTVMLPYLSYTEDAEIIARKILDVLNSPFFINDQECHITASIGIALYPRDGENIGTLLKHADIAMYRVKASGKNDFSFFAPEMEVSYRNRFVLENEMLGAIKNSQLELYYQPQVRTSKLEIVGFEALVRWHHPVYGLLNPGAFIEIIEESGLIDSLTTWVMENACRQLKKWHSQGLNNLRVAVNVSPHEFERSDIVGRILNLLDKYELPPGSLEIEITEKILLHDSQQVIEKMQALRERGVLISIDDFGTCYSSLNYLRQFPVNTIKIDRSFVCDLSEQHHTSPIIPAIIGIARGFGLHLVTEGVETEYQFLALKALGCDDMQGYYFSMPLPVSEIDEMLLKEDPFKSVADLRPSESVEWPLSGYSSFRLKAGLDN